MAAVSSRAGQARPAAPMATADLEAAIAALPVRKQRLRETFERLVACAPPHYQLPFTWDDIDAHASSLHASLSLRFRQMQLQPHPVSATATHDDEPPRLGTATPEEEQPHPGAPVPAAQDDESIQAEDEEMVSKDEDASPVQDDDEVEKDREDAGTGFAGAPCREAGRTRDQEFPVPMHAGSPMRWQPSTAFQPDVHSQLNLPMLQRQQFPPDVHSQLNLPLLQRQLPYTPYAQQEEFPAMSGAMNSYNIPPMVLQPYYNIPPVVQQPYVPYRRQQEFSPDFRQEFFPDVPRQQPLRQEFFPDVTRQPPMGIDHVLQEQDMAMVQQPYVPYFRHVFRQEFSPDFRRDFSPDVTRQPPMSIDHLLQEQDMAMAHREPYFPPQRYMAHHQPHFPVAQAASAHAQGSNAKRRPPNTYPDNINVGISEPSKKSRTIHKNTIYDYF